MKCLSRSKFRVFAPFVLISSSVLGCADLLGVDSTGDTTDALGTQGEDAPSAEEGSCDAWKISYCKAITECEAFATQEECEVDVGYVRCLEGAPLGKCAAQIDAALEANECSELPKGCSPREIADRTEPTALCEQIYEAMCEKDEFCNGEQSTESCVAGLQAGDPCSQYTAAWPAADTCAEEINRLKCAEPLPVGCQGVLRY